MIIPLFLFGISIGTSRLSSIISYIFKSVITMKSVDNSLSPLPLFQVLAGRLLLTSPSLRFLHFIYVIIVIKYIKHI